MKKSLAVFLEIAVTVIVIVALLFRVGYDTVEDEVNHYIDDDITHTNHELDTSAVTPR